MMKLTDLIEAGGPERLTTGYFFTEGPVWMPDGTLIFSDIPGNTMYRWHADGSVTRFRYPSHSANGNTVDQQGRLITCEHDMRRVSRTEEDGTVVTVADRYHGKRLNSPNDVIVKSDGAVYFTDPVAHSVPQDEVEQECNGVYRALPDGSVERLVDDMAYPNGLAFNPDESVLYVVDSHHQHLRAFEVHADGSVGNSRVHIDLGHPQSGFHAGGPDGMKVDIQGNLFITAADGIWVFRADGAWLGKLSARSDQRHSEPAANLAWGGEDGKSLFVTACSSLYRFQLKAPATNS